jgi:hypothetical protein
MLIRVCNSYYICKLCLYILGVCSCFTYYMGPDCSIDERDGLTISDIEGGGECDLADGEECECFYVRSENIQDNFTCSVHASKVLLNIQILFSFDNDQLHICNIKH